VGEMNPAFSATCVNTTPSVRPSVCPIEQQQRRRPADSLLAPCGQEISIRSCGRRAAGAGTQQQGRGALCILLFIAGRGRKAYWKRGWWRGGANAIAGCMLLARRATNHIELKIFNAEKKNSRITTAVLSKITDSLLDIRGPIYKISYDLS